MEENKRIRFTAMVAVLTIIMAAIMIWLEGRRSSIAPDGARTGVKSGDEGMRDSDEDASVNGLNPAPPTDEEGIEITTGLKLFLKSKKVEFSGVIVGSTYPLEFFACSGDDKAHETVVMTPILPRDIHTALLALNLKDKRGYSADGPKFLGDTEKPAGDRVILELSWDEKGKRKALFAEDLVYYDRKNNTTMPRVGWVFSGSEIKNEIDPDTGKSTGRNIYMANVNGSLVATYHDPMAVFDTPLSIGASDEIFFPNSKALPPVGTPAIVSIRVPGEKELEIMLDNERKFEEAVKNGGK